MKNKYFNRDLSWLSFNGHVLAEANDPSVPLYERIKFLSIYSSNLDEFFRVRVAFIKRMLQLDKEKLNTKSDLSSPKKLLSEINTLVDNQQNLFGIILRKTIVPELKQNGINLYYSKPYEKEHLEAVEELFYSKILSFIQPIIIPKDAPSPIFLENRQLYIICDLHKSGNEYIGIINIPSEINRIQQLPTLNKYHHFTFIDDIIKQYSNIIFSGFTVKKQNSVKLNRDAELFLGDDYGDDITKKIKKSLNNRKIGVPSRFLYEPEISKSTLEFLKESLKLKDDDCVSGGAYHNVFDLFSLPNPVGKKLENIPLPPLPHPDLDKTSSIFDAIDKKDVFLSFPYQKYNYILRLFNQAAIDPTVTSIKATLYRVAKDSHITNALISAAKNGKDVAVLVETKARFDEENNLKWAEEMQSAGVKVKFSSDTLKVHSKIALITRVSAKNEVCRYAFLGTGNFNEKTADIYTDFALLTSDPILTKELDDTLNYIIGGKEKIKLNHLLVAQVNMPRQFIQLINNEIAAAISGKESHITLKLNNLQDKKMIKKLYEAADQGVQIDLIIRGICCLIPRKNINLIRIVDRFLEHARVYIFHNLGDEKIYVGSADWMERNLYRRIEVVFPIYDVNIKELIKHNIQLQLEDNTKAVVINNQLENIKVNRNSRPVRAQYDFYQYLKNSIAVKNNG